MPVNTKHPDEMTAEERMQEIAAILARAISTEILQISHKQESPRLSESCEGNNALLHSSV